MFVLITRELIQYNCAPLKVSYSSYISEDEYIAVVQHGFPLKSHLVDSWQLEKILSMVERMSGSHRGRRRRLRRVVLKISGTLKQVFGMEIK